MATQDVVVETPTVFKAGATMQLDQEPSKDETTVTKVEDTTLKNEVTTPAKAESGGDAKHPSKVISDLGEDRKRLGGKLIELARESETAREQVLQMIEEDSGMATFFKPKFGADYDALVSGKPAPKAVDAQKIREEERIKARAELIMEELGKNKMKQGETLAEQFGFSTDEAERLHTYAKLLEPESKDYDEALRKAALVVNQDKANAGSSENPITRGGQEVKAPSGKNIEVTPELRSYARSMGRKAEDVAEGLKRVEARFKDNVFTLGEE